MDLSLSVRIAEGFLSKDVAELNLRELCELASRAGYDLICMRASQVGVQSEPQAIDDAAGTIESASLAVSMVTGNRPSIRRRWAIAGGIGDGHRAVPAILSVKRTRAERQLATDLVRGDSIRVRCFRAFPGLSCRLSMHRPKLSSRGDIEPLHTHQR